MSELKDILRNEIEEFRDIGHIFLEEKMSVMAFKHKSGGMGVYAHRDGKKFMLRLRIPSGVTNIKELKLIRDYVKKYKLDGIHLTTRQAIQLHGMSIDEICDLMKDALEKNLFTRGSGGDYPRNVALSPLSGVIEDEGFDPTPYALAVGNHFLRKIYTYKLPRKLKVSFSNNNKDTAHCTIQDLGFLAIKKDDKNYFKVYIGGGLGNNPRKALEYDELIEAKDVLYYVEAMTNLFIAEGDYKNRSKARIRYIADRMGDELFINTFKKYVKAAKEDENLEMMIFPSPNSKEGIPIDIKSERLIEEKTKGLYSVYVQPIGGQLKIEDLEIIINLIEKYKDVDIRLSMNEGIYFRNLNGKETEELLKATEYINAGNDLEKSVSCIGVPICQMGICNSQSLLHNIIDYFRENKYSDNIIPKIFISGCHNSCGVHEIGKIGFTGKKKKVNGEIRDVFSLFIGGKLGMDKTKLGEVKGEMLPEEIPEFLYVLYEKVKGSNMTFEEFVDKKDELDEIINEYIV